MLVGWLGVASAAGFEGELFGKAFAPNAALGLTDPAQPGMLSVLVTTEALTCAKAREMRAGGSTTPEKKKKPPPPMMIAAFADVQAGALAQTVLTLGPKGMGALGGSVTLTSAPTTVGGKGTLAVALAATPGARDGAFGAMVKSEDTDRLQGEVTFELCDALTERPSLAGTVFEPTRLHVVRKSLFPDTPPDEMDLDVPLPKGWTAGESQLGSPQWTAPDGATRLTLGLQSPSEPFESSSRDWAESQVKAFQTDSTQGELLVSKLAGEGAYVVRWRYRWGDGPWSNALEVFRQGAGWAHAVNCKVEGSDTAVAEVFDAAEAACVALTAAPAAP
jgi:hypothetical protein